MLFKLLILSFLILAVSLLAMGLRILLIKGGRFPEFHVGRNREMKKRGITCAQNTDVGCTPSSAGECASCRYSGNRSNSPL